jgi:ectoine hydroxylase-related dioxygenase (phytanoyl-CoA dioxygenase family)
MVSIALEPPFLDARLFAAARVMPLIRAVVGQDCVLNNLTSVVSLPGAPAQHMHKDGALLFDATIGAPLPCHALTLVVPLIDLDEKTGTTALFPGTHRRESAQYATGPARLPRMKMGGCYVMDYRLSHQGTPNTSARPRPILYVVYSRPWFIDANNFNQIPALRASRAHLSSIGEEHHELLARVLTSD